VIKSGDSLNESKKTDYLCPVCREGNLVEINTEKDFGDVNIKFKTMDGINFEFTCKTKNDNFFLCANEKCRARLERSDWKEGKKWIGPPCPSIKCRGSLNTYKNVPIAKIYPKKGDEDVVISYGDGEPLHFKVITGKLSYDEAGICTQCRYVGPKEIDLR
jgi:hypothetical protein